MSLERPLVWTCEGAQLLGILHCASKPTDTGVVVVVGGPQYRAGSHRQFLLLARHLAGNGVPVLRFDCRGMGDSEGDPAGFEHIDVDIACAIDAMYAALPELNRVVLWGLCDAASAAMFYARRDPRVAGVVLLNPWIRSATTQAKTYLRHYYVSQLKTADFWWRMFAGRVAVPAAVRALVGNLALALWPDNDDPAHGGAVENKAIPFPERMLRGLQAFDGRVLLILSGNDLTAVEFKDAVAASRRWRRVFARPAVTWRELPQATHTFSSASWRDQVAAWTLDWLRSWSSGC